MSVLRNLRNIVYLISGVIIAFWGLKVGLYGLIISIFGGNLHDITVNELYRNGAGVKRYLKILDGEIINPNISNWASEGEIESYVYCLALNDSAQPSKVVAVVESRVQFEELGQQEIVGTLKPFWFRIDEQLVDLIIDSGADVSRNTYYLELNSKPWKWYWNLLILFISGLFLYRMTEAAYKGINHEKKMSE